MHGIRSALHGRLYYRLDIEVALGGRGATDVNRPVGLQHVKRRPVGIRVYGHRLEAQLAARANDAHGNLGPIGDKDAAEHQQSSKKETGGHQIQIQPGTQLQKIVKQQTLEVNTTHHQAVNRLGKGLVVNAIAEDGLIEGIESSRHSFVLGLQWHPEVLAAKNLYQRRIFSFFIDVCKRLRRGA